MENDPVFYVRTEFGNICSQDAEVTMSPAFRRMLRELDGTRSVAELGPLFPHLDTEDLDLWLSELERQKMIARATGRLASPAQRVSEALPAPKSAPPKSEMGKSTRPAEPGGELTRTARMVAVEASTTASSMGREGFFMSPAGARQPLPADGQRLILVVEDDELQAQMAARILQTDGHLIRLAASGEASRAALLERPMPDLVLLDVELPDTDGFTLLKQMRAHPVYQLMRVVMLTARADRADIAKGILLGADGYLTKPYRPEMIKMAVRQALAG